MASFKRIRRKRLLREAEFAAQPLQGSQSSADDQYLDNHQQDQQDTGNQREPLLELPYIRLQLRQVFGNHDTDLRVIFTVVTNSHQQWLAKRARSMQRILVLRRLRHFQRVIPQ